MSHAPRSKADLAELSVEALRDLATRTGVSPAGDKDALVERIEQRGVAYVSDTGHERELGDPDDPGYDPDAQAIGDESLKTLPEGHPGWNDIADPADIRKPNQTDAAPTADHRAPETRDAGESMDPDNLSGRAEQSMLEHDSSQETEQHGVMKDVHPDEGEQTVTTEESERQAAAEREAMRTGVPAAPADADSEELRGQALDDKGKELGIAGFSSMSADEKREAVAKAEQG